MKPGCPPSPVGGGDLSPLDKDRAHSMADEGGAAAALVEGEDPCDPSELAKFIDDGTLSRGPGRRGKARRGEGARKK